MASGFGKDGNISRCYGFWKNWSYCVAEKGYSRKCVPYRDDYLECLHHGKEVRCVPSLWPRRASLVAWLTGLPRFNASKRCTTSGSSRRHGRRPRSPEPNRITAIIKPYVRLIRPSPTRIWQVRFIAL